MTSTSIQAPTTAPPTTTAVLPPGEVWQSLNPPFDPIAAVGVGERLWIARLVDDVPVFASTIDGVEWDQYDLATLGMPTQSEVDMHGTLIWELTLGSWGGHLYALVPGLAQAGFSADGVEADLWVVTTDGAPDGGLKLIPPAESGLDQRLAGPDNYRIMNFGNAITGTERPAFTALAQFWRPRATSDADFAVIELGVDGSWSIVNNTFDDGPLFPSWGGLSDGVPISVAVTSGPNQEFATWTRTASGWQVSRTPLPPGATEAFITGIASAPDRVVAVGVIAQGSTFENSRPAAWTTVDGITWSAVELPGGEISMYFDNVRVVWTGQEFIAISSRLGPVWSSLDGLTWTIVGHGQARHLTLWDGRVVAIGGELAVSPPVSPGASAPSPITGGQPAQSVLARGLRDHWTFQGAAGDRVTIRLTSDAFDPYLELFGPDWTLLVADDDSGGDFNALIAQFSLPSAGSYTIVARGYRDTESGPYELTLEVN